MGNNPYILASLEEIWQKKRVFDYLVGERELDSINL